MSSPPGAPSPFARRSGCPLCGIVATPYPRGDVMSNLDASLSSSTVYGGDGAAAVGSSPSTHGYEPYVPLRRDSGSPASSGSTNSNRNSGLGYGGVPINATTHSSTTNVIVYKDPKITAYIEKKIPV